MEHAEIVSALADLEKHPGWALVRDRYDVGVKQVEQQALDQATPDDLTLKLKHAHGLLVEASPEQHRIELMAKHRAKAIKAAQAAMTPATDGTGKTTEQ